MRNVELFTDLTMNSGKNQPILAWLCDCVPVITTNNISTRSYSWRKEEGKLLSSVSFTCVFWLGKKCLCFVFLYCRDSLVGDSSTFHRIRERYKTNCVVKVSEEIQQRGYAVLEVLSAARDGGDAGLSVADRFSIHIVLARCTNRARFLSWADDEWVALFSDELNETVVVRYNIDWFPRHKRRERKHNFYSLGYLAMLDEKQLQSWLKRLECVLNLEQLELVSAPFLPTTWKRQVTWQSKKPVND